MSHPPTLPFFLALALTIGVCGCQKSIDPYANDAPRSTDFDPVPAPPVGDLFEKGESDSAMTELYVVDESAAPQTASRELPDVDDAPQPEQENDAKPKPRRSSKRRTPLVRSVRPTVKQDMTPQIQLALYREGDQFRQNQLVALEAGGPPMLSVSNWINSKPLQLHELRGRIIVLDFWATWCQPCIASVPHNNALAQKYKKHGVVFIGVCHPQGAERMAEVANKAKIGYPIAADTNGLTVNAYQVDQYPDYYLIDRQGRLRLADCRNGEVEQAIKALLSEDQKISQQPRVKTGVTVGRMD